MLSCRAIAGQEVHVALGDPGVLVRAVLLDRPGPGPRGTDEVLAADPEVGEQDQGGEAGGCVRLVGERRLGLVKAILHDQGFDARDSEVHPARPAVDGDVEKAPNVHEIVLDRSRGEMEHVAAARGEAIEGADRLVGGVEERV